MRQAGPYALRVRFSDESLARRLEAVGNRFMLEWLSGTGAELERFGTSVASVDPARPELDFVNRVYELWPEDKGQVGEIARFYRDRGVRGWFEVAPSGRFEQLASALTDAGAAQIDFHGVLHGPPRAGERGEVDVQRADDPQLFAELLLTGHGVPASARTRDAASVARWANIDGWRLYVARVDGRPAGAGLLAEDDDVGYLANASTLPDYRNRGVQTALIAARMADALASGCELVASQAQFGSASQRNLERAGLRVAYTKAVWRLGERG